MKGTDSIRPSGARSGRDRAVESARRALLASGLPRLLMLALVTLAGASGFLLSFALLHGGVTAMWLRYPIAVVAAYAVFLGLLRLWLWTRGLELSGPDLDVPDVGGVVHGGGGGGPAHAFHFGGGGDFGGGGATDAFGAAAAPPAGAGSGGGGLDAGGCFADVDDAAAVVLVLAALLAAVAAACYVVYIAPVLLAEILVDAVLVAGLYRTIRREERRHWLWTAVRRTWVPVLVIAAFLAGAGYVMQRAVPGARSAGEFWRGVSRT